MSEEKDSEQGNRSLNGDIVLSSEPGTKPQGDVLIEIPVNEYWDGDLQNVVTSLEAKGWNVHLKWLAEGSFEDNSSDGTATGRPMSDTAANAAGANNIINGVTMPQLDEKSVYKVVQIVRPEDTLPGGDSKILYLMNGNGDVKEYMQNEGYLIADEIEGLHTVLTSTPAVTDTR